MVNALKPLQKIFINHPLKKNTMLRKCGALPSFYPRTSAPVSIVKTASQTKDVKVFSSYLGEVTLNCTDMGNNLIMLHTCVPGMPGQPEICVKSIDAKLNGISMDMYVSLATLMSYQSTVIDVETCRKNALLIASLKALETRTPDQETALYTAILYNDAVDIHFASCQYLTFIHKFFAINNIIVPNALVSLHNFHERVDNAFFWGDNMRYGNGKTIFRALGSLDIGGHELGHGVVQTLASLNYQGESGALNEAFADVFGTSFEIWMYAKFKGDGDPSNDLKGLPDVFVGEDVTKVIPYLRNMANPELGTPPQPSKYKGLHWVDPSDLNNDFGGVHSNSGVINKCWHILYTRTGLVKALSVFIATLRALTPSAKFADFATAFKTAGVKMGHEKDVWVALIEVGL